MAQAFLACLSEWEAADALSVLDLRRVHRAALRRQPAGRAARRRRVWRTAQMQAIAAEFNYSETTFVLPPADPGPSGARCGSSRPGPRCRSPAIRRSARRWSWLGWAGCRRRASSCWRSGWTGPGAGCARAMAGGLRRVRRPAAPRRTARPCRPEPLAAALGLDAADLVTSGGLPCVASLRRAVSAGRAREPRGPGQGRARRRVPSCRRGAVGVHLCSRARPAMPRSTCAPACSRPRTASPRIRRRAAPRRPWRAISAGGRASPMAGMPGASRRGSRWAGRA